MVFYVCRIECPSNSSVKQLYDWNKVKQQANCYPQSWRPCKTEGNQKEAKASNSKRNTGLNEDKGGLFHRLNRTWHPKEKEARIVHIGYMCSHEVPDRFSTCSWRSQCVLQHVPYSSSLDPISFDLSLTLEIYITSLKEEIRTYLFGDCPKLDKCFLWCANDAHHKRKINKFGSHHN